MRDSNIQLISVASLQGPTTECNAILKDGKTIYVNFAYITHLLSEVFKAPYKVLLPSDGAFGAQLPHGNWSGLVGMLIRSEVDLAVDIGLSEARSKAVNFSYPYFFTEVVFMTDKPKRISTSSALFRPFPLSVWVLLGGFVLAISYVVFLLTKKKQTYRNITFIFSCSLLEQSVGLNLKKWNLKRIVGMWFIFIFFIINSYKAVLLSFITLPSFTGIRTIFDLNKAAEQNSIICYTLKGSLYPQLIQQAYFEFWTFIGKCLLENQITATQALQTYLKAPPGKVFVGLRIYLEPYKREYYISEESFFTQMYAFPISKKFCCTDYLNEVIHRLFAAGVLQKLFKEDQMHIEMRNQGTAFSIESTDTKMLQLQDMKIAFVILLFGYILSFIVLCFEIMLQKGTFIRIRSNILKCNYIFKH